MADHIANPGSPLEKVLSRLGEVKKSGEGYMAHCPAHIDNKRSLSVKETDMGVVLLKCFAGCQFEEVLKAINLEKKDLFPPKQKNSNYRANPKARIDQVYHYVDADGKELYQVVRYIPKDFKQRIQKPNGGFIWSTKGVKRVLYQLPTVIERVKNGLPIVIVEGEKDVHNLRGKLRIPATTKDGGAKSKWLKSFSEVLSGAEVIIIPDNDPSGEGQTQDIAQSLQGYARSVKVVELPDLPEKGDVSDWIEAGGTAEELQKLIDAAPEWEPTPCQPVDNDHNPALAAAGLDCPFKRPLTDSGNGERLIDAHGADLRFNVDAGRWLIWNGHFWEADWNNEVDRRALDVVRKLADEIIEMGARLKDAKSKEEQVAILSNIEQLGRHKLASESRAKLDAMIAQARKCKGVAVRTSDLDADPWLFNCLNGTIDLRTGTLQPHAREDHITKRAPVEYDAAAPSPRWQQFLREVFMDNEELTAFVRRMVGYCLTGSTREEAVFILVGKGGNGKSKMLDALRAVMGDYAGDTPFTTFMEKRDTSTFDLAGLEGKRLVAASEGEGEQSFNESLLKQLSGGDPVTCCYKYRDYFTYVPKYKVLCCTNEVPHISSQNRAMKRRLKLIPFRQTFYQPHEGKQPVRDDELLPKLLAEKNGILAWAVEGCREWHQSGLNTPVAIQREVDRLFESQDPLGEWLDTQCEILPGAQEEVGELWRAYRHWCDETGRKPAFKQTHRFSQSLSQRDGIDSRRGHGGVRILSGIGLKDRAVMVEEDPDTEEDDASTEDRVTHGDAKNVFSENLSREEISMGTFPQKPIMRHHASPTERGEPENGGADGSGNLEYFPHTCSQCGADVEAWQDSKTTISYKCPVCPHQGRLPLNEYEEKARAVEVESENNGNGNGDENADAAETGNANQEAF